MKFFSAVGISELNLADRKSDSIANVIRGLCTCLRTPTHYDAHETDRKRFCTKPDRFVTARPALHFTVWKPTPLIFLIGVQMHRIVSAPVFDPVLFGVRCAPSNLDRVHRLSC